MVLIKIINLERNSPQQISFEVNHDLDLIKEAVEVIMVSEIKITGNNLRDRGLIAPREPS